MAQPESNPRTTPQQGISQGPGRDSPGKAEPQPGQGGSDRPQHTGGRPEVPGRPDADQETERSKAQGPGGAPLVGHDAAWSGRPGGAVGPLGDERTQRPGHDEVFPEA